MSEVQTKPQTTAAPAQFTSAATDVPELVQELNAGQFERLLSIALSQCAAASVDNNKKAKVKVEFDIEPISGTHQVHLHHKVSYTKPTANGKSSEEDATKTTLHVGKYGKLSLVPENQIEMFQKAKKPAKA